LNPNFTAANSVVNGIHPIPNQTTGGEGPVTGEEVQFTILFTRFPQRFGSGAQQTSRMIHIEDQYTGTPDQGGTVAKPGIIRYNVPATTYYAQDLATLVHAAGRTFGTGLQHVVNMFYNQGVDLCPFDGVCYSPDNLSTWNFCAYHNYYDFPDIGRVIFTMQPYANVGNPNLPASEAGCQVPPGGMHSQAVESMANALSHETFEAISDPEVSAWVQGFIDYEMADLCIRLWYDIPLAGPTYRLQGEYSNQHHACVWTP